MRNEALILLLQQKVSFGGNVGVGEERKGQRERGGDLCSLVEVKKSCVSRYTHWLNFMLICILLSIKRGLK